MRALSADEIKAIAGGLSASSATGTLSEVHVTAPSPVTVAPVVIVTPTVPASSGGSGSGSGAGSGDTTGSSSGHGDALTVEVLGYVNSSALFKEELDTLTSQGWNVIYGQDPLAPTNLGAAAESANKTIYISDTLKTSALGTAQALAHEVYHALHPIDRNPLDYSSESAFVSAVMTNEGGAQVNSIQVSEQSGKLGIPGNSIDTAKEKQIYSNDMQHYSGVVATNVASTEIGEYMKNVNIADGVTYEEYYSSQYEKAHK